MSVDRALRPECRVTSNVYQGTVVLHIQGELFGESAAHLRTELKPFLREARVLLELSGVTSLDNSGLEAVLGAVLSIQESHGRVAVAAAQPPVARVLRLAGLGLLTHSCLSAQEALQWISAPDLHPSAGHWR